MEYALESTCGNNAVLKGTSPDTVYMDSIEGTNAMLRGVTADTAPINFKTKINFGDMSFNNCLMYLEPRLQEYIKKKEYFTKNHIKPSISLEQEYGITKIDMININKLMKCKDKENCGLIQTPYTYRTTGRPKCGNVQVTKFVDSEGDKFKIQKRGITSSLESFQCTGKPKEGFENINDAGSVPGLQTIPCQSNKFVQTSTFASKYSPKSYSYFNYATDNNANYYQQTRAYTHDNFNRNNQYIYKADPNNDWKQVSEQKPMKYRLDTTHAVNPVGRFEQPRSINQNEIDQDTFMRPSYVDQDLSGISRESFFDTCLMKVIPGERNRSCYDDGGRGVNHSFFINPGFMGAGSGSGDTNIESDMKQSLITRFKEKRGPQPLDRFETLDRDINQTEPFIRGGYDSRQQDKYSKKDAQYII